MSRKFYARIRFIVTITLVLLLLTQNNAQSLSAFTSSGAEVNASPAEASPQPTLAEQFAVDSHTVSDRPRGDHARDAAGRRWRGGYYR